MSVTLIAPTKVRESLANGTAAAIVDVRTPGEFRSVHIDGAVNIPIDSVSADSIRSALHANPKELWVVCQKGSRSARACEKLLQEGLHVLSIDGGTEACIASGIPVVRGRGAISIDRQVRIVAGGLTLLGVVLGALVNPAFYGLSAFIGGGLVFAGVSDWCGMAKLLAVFPWNRA
ncbi:MAG: rhodanese-like domain-containing protein [Planctomycetota bacterium]|jgi:rhodanese-related sulfurtransferase